MATIIGYVIYALLSIASIIASYVIHRRAEKRKKDVEPVFDAIKAPTAAEGRMVPIVYGTVKLESANVLRARIDAPYKELIPVEDDKGLQTFQLVGNQQVILHVGLCRGPATIRRIWFDEVLIWSGVASGGSIFIDQAGDPARGTARVSGVVDVSSGSLTEPESGSVSTNVVDTYSIASGGTDYSLGHDIPNPAGPDKPDIQIPGSQVQLVIPGITGSPATWDVVGVHPVTGAAVTLSLLSRGSYTAAFEGTYTAVTSRGEGSGLRLQVTAIEQSIGPGLETSPPYKGTCSLRFRGGGDTPSPTTGKPLGSGNYFLFGNVGSLPSIAVEVTRDLENRIIENTSKYGFDENPANVLWDLLTNTEYGGGISPDLIDRQRMIVDGGSLAEEGLFTSFVVDGQTDIATVVDEIAEQCDIALFESPGTMLIRTLFRGSVFDIDAIRQINFDTDTVAVDTFTNTTWNGTITNVDVTFQNRDLDYSANIVSANDIGAFAARGERRISEALTSPGIKDRKQAARYAWEKVRAINRPIWLGQVKLPRTFYDLVPAQVVAVTWSRFSTKKAFRIQKLNYGGPLDGRITADLVETTYRGRENPDDPPPENPTTTPPDPVGPVLAFEAPISFTRGAFRGSHLWISTRQSNAAHTSIPVFARHALNAYPVGSYVEQNAVSSFMLLGRLVKSLTVGDTYPSVSGLVMNVQPETMATWREALPDIGADAVGSETRNWLLIDNEFIGVSAGTAQTGDDELTCLGVYRGLSDTVQAKHSKGAQIYLVRGTIVPRTYSDGDFVEAKLVPKGSNSEEATVTQTSMVSRIIRPHPPAALWLNGVYFAKSNVDVAGAGTELTPGIVLRVRRRAYQYSNYVEAVEDDAADLVDIFPTHEHITFVEVFKDADLAKPAIWSSKMDQTETIIPRISILDEQGLPNNLTIRLSSKHVWGKKIYDSIQQLVHTFGIIGSTDPDDPDTPPFYFGRLKSFEVSNSWTVDATNTRTFTLDRAYGDGAIQYRINAGAWTQLITPGNVTATLAVTATDTLELRHTSTDNAPRLLQMSGTGQTGEAVFWNDADLFWLGILDTNDVSDTWVAPTTGTYTATLEFGMSPGVVQYRLNGGSWLTAIAVSSLTGTFSADEGDAIEIRHTGTGSTNKRTIHIDSPNSGHDAAGELVTDATVDMGRLALLEESTNFTTNQTGEHIVELSAALGPGNQTFGHVYYSLNSGPWTICIQRGQKSGTIPSSNSASTIKFRHSIIESTVGRTFRVRSSLNAGNIGVAQFVTGQLQNLNTIDRYVVTKPITIPATVNYRYDIDRALDTGSIQIRRNGGQWATIIGPGTDVGFTAVTYVVGDIVEHRHTESGTQADLRVVGLRRVTGDDGLAYFRIAASGES